MAEFARWQWDDNGFWRDFGETQQMEVEAAYQRKADSVDIAIPPFGDFFINLQALTQRAKQGRGMHFERKVRRQVKRIDVGYFLLGEEGEIQDSDSVVDQIEEEIVLDTLARLLGKIVAEPEEFGHRSVNVGADEFRETIGNCREAQEFLKQKGFELIEEGPGARFLIYMHEEVEPLKSAQAEAVASLARLKKRLARTSTASSSQSNAQLPSNKWPPSNAQPPSNELPLPTNHQPSDSRQQGKRKDQFKGKGKAKKDKGKGGKSTGKGKAGKQKLVWRPRAVLRPLPEDSPLHRTSSTSDSPFHIMSNASVDDRLPTSSLGSPGALRLLLVLPGDGDGREITVESEMLDELLEIAKAKSSFRLPLLTVGNPPGLPLGLAAEPEVTLRHKAVKLKDGDQVVVEDFEAGFVEKLQSGLLTLRELALVAPLLDWDKPELSKLLLTRMKLLLEGACDAWCESAGCKVSEELECGRALVVRLFRNDPLEERLEVCRRLTPVAVREEARVKVDRTEFVGTAIRDLGKLTPQDLRGQLVIEFAGEQAEDHGGPRRDFFANFGGRLASEVPGLWRQLSKGSLVPTADLAAEASPKADRSDLDSIDDAYVACGRAFALAMKHGDVMGEELARFFVHQVALGSSVSLEQLQRDLAEAEGEDVRTTGVLLRSNLKDMGLQGQKLTRVVSGTTREVELEPGGKDVDVTEENKEKWLKLQLQDKLYGRLQKAANAFREGLLDVLGGTRDTCPWLTLITPGELSELWAGHAVGEEGVSRWQEVAVISSEVEEQASWFWNILESAEEDFRSKVLKFCTGTPRLGRAGLQSFQIQPADGGDEMLPHAMTCANMLQLPRYTSKDALEKQLRKAAELCEGFQIL